MDPQNKYDFEIAVGLHLPQMRNVHCALTFEFNNTTDEIEIQYTNAVFILEILAVPADIRNSHC